MSDQSYQKIIAPDTLEDVNLILVQLEQGIEPREFVSRLRQKLPPDVRVLTRSQLEKVERKYWLESTSSGVVFGSGAILAFIVGIVILYQVFSTEINEHLAEYATLKAIGYSNYNIAIIVIQQSLLLVCISFAFSILFALVAYDEIHKSTYTNIEMTYERLLLVFGISTTMAIVASLFSLKKILSADPADVF